MKKTKINFKKIIYKTIPCLCVFVLLFSLFIVSTSAIGYTNTIEYDNLEGVISGVSSGSFLVNDVSFMGELTVPYIQSQPISPGNYSISGVINFGSSFNPGGYYNVVFPISFDLSTINVGTTVFFLVDNNGKEYPVARKSQIYPDPFGSTHVYATEFFEFALNGSEMANIVGFKISMQGKNFSNSNSFAYFGLINGRKVLVNSISSAEYDAIYGGDYSNPNNDTFVRFDKLEGQLSDTVDFGGVKSFFENIENVANATIPLQAASLLLSELYNFGGGGARFTVFVTIATFSLVLGSIALLLNIVPRLKGGGK